MRRGFKASSDRASADLRKELGLASSDRLDADQLAAHRGIHVVAFQDLTLDAQARHQLSKVDPDSWSAFTLQEGSAYLVIVNPQHPPTRRQNDLMHEISHIELKHVAVNVTLSENGLLLLSDYSDEQEQEADWYAAALLVPRDPLFAMRHRGLSTGDIANHFGVSEALCEWRLRMTGVDVQLRRSRR